MTGSRSDVTCSSADNQHGDDDVGDGRKTKIVGCLKEPLQTFLVSSLSVDIGSSYCDLRQVVSRQSNPALAHNGKCYWVSYASNWQMHNTFSTSLDCDLSYMAWKTGVMHHEGVSPMGLPPWHNSTLGSETRPQLLVLSGRQFRSRTDRYSMTSPDYRVGVHDMTAVASWHNIGP